ncbi:MAG: radical SAM protein [Anaerolineales bacterium]|nr:radical SAM protein [Anaerolineales bacterium]
MSSRPRIASLIFEVTQRCNHACLHCYNVWAGEDECARTYPPYPRGELDTKRTLDLLGKALDETVCSHVTLTGGEPLLREDLPAILEYLRGRNVRTTVISNGRLLDQRMAADCLDRGAALFELPLLSHKREVHDRMSGAPGAWEAVLDAMANLRLLRGRFIAVFVATKLNLDDVRGTMKLAFAFGAQGMMFNRFNPGGRGRANLEMLLPSRGGIRRALEEAAAASAEFDLPVSCSIPIQPCLIDMSAFPRFGTGFCAAGTDRAYFTLDPLGNVRPCNHTPTILGNLREESFADLAASARMRAFAEAMPAFCGPCSRRMECRGGCKAAAEVCYGSAGEEEPFLRINKEHASPLTLAGEKP